MSNDLSKQPALRRWQESVYGKGPYQVPDYESMAAIVQEHEQMADRIEELKRKLARAVEALKRIELSTDTRKQGAIAMATLAKLKGEDRG